MKLLVAILVVLDLLAIGTVTWINDAQKSKCTNPFFSKGFTVYLEGKGYEIGFREDGVMVWRNQK